jgi:hypothetical protein
METPGNYSPGASQSRIVSMSIASRNTGSNGDSLLAAALDYALRGWSVLPVVGKRPAVRTWNEWQTRRADAKQLRRWFTADAVTGLAVICGAVSGGLTIRDFDDAGAYDRWAGAHANLARVLPTVQTARGWHVYCRSTAAGIVNMGDGELRASGCYCLAPPSLHPSGELYRWTITLPDGALPILNPIESGLCNRANTASADHGADRDDGDNRPPPLLVSSAPALLSAVLHALERTLPHRAGERNRQLFDLARRLKAIMPNTAPNELRPIIGEWHRRALPVIGTKPFLETWADFIVAWARVKYPAGQSPVDVAFARASAATPPAKAVELYPGQTGILLLASLCRELQAGARELFLDVRTAGRLLNVDHSTAWRWLKVLCADGILRAGEVGSKATRRASRFTYTEIADAHHARKEGEGP